MKLKPVRPGHVPDLGDDAATYDGPGGEDAVEKTTAKSIDRISKLQRLLYADGRHAVLIVLQGRDAAGKDGTIRRVFSAVNPQGCTVSSFGVPTSLEARHDFLWRVHQQMPPRGMLGIFNRSHYEDVLVPRVHGTMSKKEATARCEQINDFEAMLADNGTTILKFMLHISRDEQKRRLTERLTDETKNWKFQAGDLDDRARWQGYTRAYRDLLERTSTAAAPWYVVPADDKGVRDALVARTIADALDDLELRYPKIDRSLAGLEVQ